jgi:hypothetical protein
MHEVGKGSWWNYQSMFLDSVSFTGKVFHAQVVASLQLSFD